MARPPLSTRWGLLMVKDRVAQRGSLLACFAIAYGIFPSILPLNPAACWWYVAVVFSLQVGLLALLDYRDWVRHKVQQEASSLDPSLSVSSMLLLSSPELQDQYHKWMDKNPAVVWYPCLDSLFHFCGVLKVLSKTEHGCKACALIMHLPTMVLSLSRVFMEIGGAPKQGQSIASLVSLAYMVTTATGLMALNNPCTVSIGPDVMSPAENTVFVAIITAVQIATTPCTMQHFAALCVIAGPGDFLSCFIWAQRRHGGLGLASYPTHYVELGIVIAAAKTAASLVAAAVRYRLAHENVTAFLRSVRPHRH